MMKQVTASTFSVGVLPSLSKVQSKALRSYKVLVSFEKYTLSFLFENEI